MQFSAQENYNKRFLPALTKLEGSLINDQLPVDSVRRLFPVTSENDTVTQFLTTEIMNPVGTAEIVDDEASDYPDVSFTMSEYSTKVMSIGSSFNYSAQDLNVAMAADFSLDSTLATIGRNVMLKKEDELTLLGDFRNPNGMKGVYSHPNTAIMLPQASSTGQTTWRQKSPFEVIKDLTDAMSAIRTNSQSIEPDTLVLPQTVFTYESGRPMNPTGTMTVMNYIRATFPNLVNIGYSRLLDGSYQSGLSYNPLGTTPRQNFAMLYKFDPAVVCVHEMAPIQLLPDGVTNMRIKVFMKSRFGGIRIKQAGGLIMIPGI
jgi:hypothetical protein